MSSHNQLVAELTARWPEHRIGPGLDRERAVLDLLGNPQQACPVIQIAGTNGKGSTAIMVDSLLRSAGLRVGRYCSPHLVDVTERICIDGRPVSTISLTRRGVKLSPWWAWLTLSTSMASR
ncbi:dihydrofolate synthase [Cutibacterium acnes JCM 18918]|nr:dihydrofolate synthase [Cutibacterium acnes JCM 18918]